MVNRCTQTDNGFEGGFPSKANILEADVDEQDFKSPTQLRRLDMLMVDAIEDDRDLDSSTEDRGMCDKGAVTIINIEDDSEEDYK